MSRTVVFAGWPGPFTTGVPGSGFLPVGAVVSFVAFWLVLLGARLEEPIAEWRTLLEGRFSSADSTWAAIYGTLHGRAVPVDASAERVRGGVLSREVVNNRLVITERDCAVFVSVFPYGTSLYIGWTMWRRRRGATILGHLLRDLAGSRAASVARMQRGERVRAMREAVHAAVRAGAEVAVQGVDVPIAAAFGQDIPVRDLNAPAPAPPGSSGPAGPGSWGAAGGQVATWSGTDPNVWAPPAPGPRAAPPPSPGDGSGPPTETPA